MDSIRQDSDLAVELVPLLGRELKVARKRIQELEQAGLRQNSHTSSASLDSERAVAAEAANTTLRDNIARLKAENSHLQRELSSIEDIKPDVQSVVAHDRDQLSRLSEELNQRELVAQQHVTQIATLEVELTTLREKYKRQRAAKRKLRETCAELSTQLEDLPDENKVLTQCVHTPLEAPFFQDFKEFADYKAFVAAFPDILTRPKILDLKPLFSKTMIMSYDNPMAELTRLISSDEQGLNPEWFSDAIIWLGPILWCPTSRQHALILGSSHQYHPKEKHWTEWPSLNWAKTPTHEFFYMHDKFVYYGGTYKCHRLPDLDPGAIPAIDPGVFTTVMSTVVCNQAKKNKIHCSTISKLHQDGILKRASLNARNKRKAEKDQDDSEQRVKRRFVGDKGEEPGAEEAEENESDA